LKTRFLVYPHSFTNEAESLGNALVTRLTRIFG
jgi:hypothetical protein